MITKEKTKVAINGFGRIGRVSFRVWWQRYSKEIDLSAINTSGSMEVAEWAHLLKYDSVYGHFPAKIETAGPEKAGEIGRIVVGGKQIPILGERDPKKIPWSKYGVDLVLECTGVFEDRSAEAHFRGGAKRVIISAPPKDPSIPVFIFGVNQDRFKGENLISNGSCTTNCVAPVVKLVDQNIGFEECIMTTIHAYTSTQNIVDGSHKDLRRARAAAINIVPTGTGAAQAVIAAYPEVEGRFAASAIRVPVVCGSYSEFIFKLRKKVTKDQINQLFEKAASEELVEILKVSYEPLVSSDIIGNSASAIVDLAMTEVLSEDMVKVSAWYDNEFGYSCRLVEMAAFVSK
ncbi:MAG: type I glyceraldehyde-3-phosphate dehydrogenase [Patescibacteria group bacterium]|nr:type I glyceraldehyde-3-phosphate dehydrogenase [Patescibacteria group bacterium]